MAPTTANLVADHLIRFAHDNGDWITNLKLQKLVYYAQAWFLALYGEPLFDEPLEAWELGPVQPDLYQRFKLYRWRPIDDDPPSPEFKDPRVEPHLEEIMDVFGDFTAHHLARLTHQESPWKNARNGEDRGGAGVISLDDMRDYYAGLSADEQDQARA